MAAAISMNDPIVEEVRKFRDCQDRKVGQASCLSATEEI
jgi:hypothetical protein